MVSLRASWLDATLVLIMSCTTAHAQSGDRDRGQHIAARECAGCHGTTVAKGVTVQGVFVPSFSVIANRPYQSRERLKSFIGMPRHPMPGLPLQEDELRHLAEYIYEFRD